MTKIPRPPKAPGSDQETEEQETGQQEPEKVLSEKMTDHYNFLRDQIPKFLNDGKQNDAQQGNGQISLLEQLTPEVRKYEEQITALNQIVEQIAEQLNQYAEEIQNAIAGE